MKAVTISKVKELLGARADPAVSIYMSIDPRRSGGPADRARLRNLLRRASELLSGANERDDIDALLVPIAERARGEWPRAAAVGFLRSRQANAAFALPARVPELAVVAPTFHVKPLLDALDGHKRFFMLVLAERAARLLDGTGAGGIRIDGTAATAEAGASDLQALAAIDEAVGNILRDTGAPLVLVGPENLRRLFRMVSRYEWLLPDEIDADVEQVHAADLRPTAQALVAAHRVAVESEAVLQFISAESTGWASDDLERVARAAAAGAIRLLLHRRGTHVWGRLDPATGACLVRGVQHEAGDADVVDDLCELTLLHGGDVVEIPAERMPSNAPVAAIIARTPLLRRQHIEGLPRHAGRAGQHRRTDIMQTKGVDMAAVPAVRTELPRRAPSASRTVDKVIRVDGPFDLASARQVLACAAELTGGAVVRLDLRRAREIQDVALAAITSARTRVIVVGLSRHHERLVRYIAGSGAGAMRED